MEEDVDCYSAPVMPAMPGEVWRMGLADMPLAWLCQLVRECAHSVLPLFRTCRIFRDLVACSYKAHIDFALPMTEHDLGKATTRLLTVCRRSNDVHVRFKDPKLWPTLHKTDCCNALLTACMAAAGRPLTSVTRVHATGLVLDAVVPSWMAAACPDMRTLELEFCLLYNVKPHPRLQQLQLQALTLRVGTAFIDGMWGDGDNEDNPGNWPAWQRQLDTLPSVTSLALPVAPWFLMGCPALRNQLSHLELGLPLDDEGMEVLLDMTQLKSLRCCTFELNNHYRHRSCSWSQLHCRDLHVDQFDRLPLKDVQQLQGFRHLVPSSDVEACKRVVAAIDKCGGLSWAYHVSLHNRTSRADHACLAVLLPMLSGAESMSFSVFDVHVTRDLLTTLSRHLGKCAFKRVSFHECTWAADVWAHVLPSLPHARVKIEADMLQEAWVTEMCAHAVQPVEVDIFCRGQQGRGAQGAWEEGWVDRVQSAMTAAGHQHVRLSARFTQWY